jgi:hypothetical protein
MAVDAIELEAERDGQVGCGRLVAACYFLWSGICLLTTRISSTKEVRVPDIAGQRAQIEELIAESERLQSRMERWQELGEVSDDEIRTTHREYLDWYNQALLVVHPDELLRFKDMYEGGAFIERIRAFLNSPLEINQFYKPDEPNPLLLKWRRPFEARPRESLATQREILVHALHQTADVVKVLDELSAYFRRLPEFLDTLRNCANPNVPRPTITNERDLQHLVHALLRMLYDDVRPEDYVPEHAGARSRVDFLLRDVGVLVETKMTREGLEDRRVGEELLIDWGRYQRHPDCRGIFALIYDPDRRIRNVTGLESDLSNESGPLWTRVIVVR